MRGTERQMLLSLELKKSIARNIRKYRKERKMTQEKLSELADISYDFMRRIETTDGTCGLSIITLYKIALALNVSIDDLVGNDIKITVDE